ncbi:plasmid mobilization protein [Dinghuibacter silviterrae]|uniref:Mobilization protein MobC n=1 Tax=Dinghuibacter silviterrae TaxID=1539049 RepID=A0A4R8DH85_9BACT|nr:plasmid mobilization relaxosome protein MobC [Dinghuibacter silviterrae]TDW97069.1 mobilization protein MobC [Dinghuibacter silviterrae]
MGRKKTPEDKELKHRLYTRVNDRKYAELRAILDTNPQKDMSALLRDILHDRRVKVFTHDQTLDNLMEELALLRTELKAIGVNINQITHKFNTYPETTKKALYAKIAFEEYQAIDAKVNTLLVIIEKLAKKWLSA